MTDAIPCPWCPRRWLTPAAVPRHLKTTHPEHDPNLSHEALRRLHVERTAARKATHDTKPKREHPITERR